MGIQSGSPFIKMDYKNPWNNKDDKKNVDLQYNCKKGNEFKKNYVLGNGM